MYDKTRKSINVSSNSLENNQYNSFVTYLLNNYTKNIGFYRLLNKQDSEQDYLKQDHLKQDHLKQEHLRQENTRNRST